jgi:hypothetical protein
MNVTVRQYLQQGSSHGIAIVQVGAGTQFRSCLPFYTYRS